MRGSAASWPGTDPVDRPQVAGEEAEEAEEAEEVLTRRPGSLRQQVTRRGEGQCCILARY